MSLYKYVLLFSCLFFLVGAKPKNSEFKKTIRKEFKLDPSGNLTVNNKYGTINIIPWEQDKVEFEIVVTVGAKNKEEAEKKLNMTQIEFLQEGNTLTATTEKEEESKGWKNWSYKNYKSSSESYSVDYTIKMPCVSLLTLNNKHGHINIPSLDSDVIINLKYGNLTSGSLGGDLDLTLKYGKANLQEMKNLTADVGYSKFVMTNTDKFKMVSKYSKFSIGNVGNANITSKYDTYSIQETDEFSSVGKYDSFSIGKATSLSITAKYSDYHINTLNTGARAELSYGNLVISRTESSFTSADFEGSYSDLNITLPKDLSYEVDIEGNYTGISYPDAGLTNKHYEKDGSRTQLKGTYGNNPGNKYIKAVGRYGSIRLKN